MHCFPSTERKTTSVQSAFTNEQSRSTHITNMQLEDALTFYKLYDLIMNLITIGLDNFRLHQANYATLSSPIPPIKPETPKGANPARGLLIVCR